MNFAKNMEISSEVTLAGNEAISIVAVSTEEELRRFIELPNSIYANDPYWPGQDDEEAIAYFHPGENDYVHQLDIRLFLAIKEGVVVGRIAGCLNDRFNEFWGTNVGFFGFFEAINDNAVAYALFHAAEEYVKESGKSAIWGPMNFTCYDNLGLLLDNFDTVPTISLPYNLQYYQFLIEKCGYTKVKDVVELKSNRALVLERAKNEYQKLAHMYEEENLIVRSLNPQRFQEEVCKIHTVFSQSFVHHWGVTPLTEAEFAGWIGHYYPQFIPEDLFVIMEKGGEMIGYGFFAVDNNEQKCAERNGRDSVKVRKIFGAMLGMLPEYQAKFHGKLLLMEAIQRLWKYDFDEFQMGWILEDNVKSLSLAKRLGGTVEKTFRIYQKNL